MNAPAPAIDDLRALSSYLQPWLLRTPVLHCKPLELLARDGQEIHAKLEFLQRTGTFKPRAALSALSSLSREQIRAGITAVSAGNHAIAAAYAAKIVGTSAKVVMTGSASRLRVQRCRDLGAQVVVAGDAHQAFEWVEEIRRREGRYLLHPFEGPHVAKGTGTLGLEICEQIGDFDTIILPIGGGGLCAGISNAVKQLNPGCRVIGVEPVGADSMHRSFASGKPESIEKVRTIADSLGAPFAMNYSYGLCRDNVDDLVLIDDAQIRLAMGTLFHVMKIAVEPACAATTAALLGPLRGKLNDQKIVMLFCGSNIDWSDFANNAELDPGSVD